MGGYVAIGVGAFFALGVLMNAGRGASIGSLIAALLLFAIAPIALGVALLRQKVEPRLVQHARDAWDAELLRLAARRDGSLTVSEVMAHADLDAARAEAYLDDLCQRGYAEHRVTDDGQIVYRFEAAPSPEQKRSAKGVLDD